MRDFLKPGKLPAAFLQQLIQGLPTLDQSVVVPPGIGLDAAGLKIGERLIAVTTDPITLASANIATYSVAVNINDIACLGCRPRWYLATLLLPLGTRKQTVQKLWQELAVELKRYHLLAVGGHVEVTAVVKTPVLVGQLIGTAMRKKLLSPRDMRSGDQILLCRAAAIEGTALLAKERVKKIAKFFSQSAIKKMQNLLYKPGICIWSVVEKIANEKGLVALHDPTEGGIATALHELADAGGLGLEIDGDAIPFLEETLKLAQIFKFNPLGLLASGSVLMVARPGAVKNIIAKLSGEVVVKIGTVTKQCARSVYLQGQKKKLPRFDRDEIVRALQRKS
jgi:hydrogenase expression/formation protein HypE